MKAALTGSSGMIPGYGGDVRIAQADAAISMSAPADLTPTIKPNYLLLEAAGFTDPASVSWGAVSWGAVSWGAVSWGAVSWGAVSWGSVSWGNVTE